METGMALEEKTFVETRPGWAEKGQKKQACLIVISARSSAAIGRMIQLDRPDIVIGRSAEADIQLEDEGISRKHAMLSRTADGRYRISDLGSTNGTHVNGVRLLNSDLSNGDQIQVGSQTVLKFSIQNELEEQFQKRLYDSAIRDSLTGTYNKKYLLEALRKEFSHCLRQKLPLSLAMIDIDHFKQVNDTHGHVAGDRVLADLAARIEELVREEDILARYGGEEFALMLRGTGPTEAFGCADRCRQAIDEAAFLYQGIPLKLTVSLGVATLMDANFDVPDELISAADEQLYRAKRTGRNRVAQAERK
jgi:diguanylate cyclase (GGDEF)-like protein